MRNTTPRPAKARGLCVQIEQSGGKDMAQNTNPEQRDEPLEIVFGLRLLQPWIFIALLIIGVMLSKALDVFGGYLWQQLTIWGTLLCRT